MAADPRRKIFNKEHYILEVFVKRLNEEGDLKEDFEDFSLLFLDHLSELEIVNDLFSPILRGFLIYNDIGYKIFPFIRSDGNSYIDIKIQRINVNDDSDNIFEELESFEHTFLITDVQLAEKRLDGGTYRVNLISINWLFLNNSFMYSSVTEKTSTQILKELITGGGLTLFKERPDKPFVETDERIFFLTPANWELIDSIDYMLTTAINKDKGLYFIEYNHIRDDYRIVSLKEDHKLAKQNLDVDNILNLTTKNEAFSGPLIHRAISDISEKNYNQSNQSLELSKALIFNAFNYLEREFTQEDLNFNQISNTLPSVQGVDFRKIIKNEPQKVPNGIRAFTKELTPVDFSFYERMRRLFSYTDVIEFKVYGVLKRNISQFINIRISENAKTFHNYDGLWYITRIFHSFDRSHYHNTIQACRIDEREPIIRSDQEELLSEIEGSIINAGQINKVVN